MLVVTSTTGQGDVPANARQFWKSILRRKLPPTYLSNVHFTTFGLGDSSYPKFNWAARKLHKRISQLGADEFYPRGEADEQHDEGLDATFVPWMTDIRRHLLERYPLEGDLEPIPEATPIEPKWILALRNDCPIGQGNTAVAEDAAVTSSNGQFQGNPSPYQRTNSQCLNVVLQENRRLTPTTHWQDVRQLSFTSSSVASYGPGDILTIFPRNPPQDVETLLDLMGWTSVADQEVCFIRNKSFSRYSHYSPPSVTLESTSSPMSLRKILTISLDINAIPKRSFFAMIAHFTDDEMQKERLLEFVNPEYVDELYDYTTRPRRSILEVLQEFDSVKIPWQWAASVLPELRGRQFSIASGGQLKTDSHGHVCFELLVAIVRYKTVIKKIREGVCTRYLAALPEGSSLDVTLQKGSLGVSKEQTSRPLVMIGPGTGIAPIRSLVWERLQRGQQTQARPPEPSNGSISGKIDVGEMALFFGCRNKDADYFYQEEWYQLRKELPLQTFTAFSRDQKHKVYVQDVIREHSELVSRLLHELEGVVYVCGSSGKMPKAVRTALTEAFTRCGKMHQGDAEAYLQKMEKEGRYKQETW
ncbi:MAG: NAPDH-dependent diflavin reductase [Heterodermia speciosa]|uniref:NADPH-dependent diflavin oxidoreductase 1 n=1 Tax=Heterodermia speciosa TaxID=116794 RepID=A0A8H3I970_9LECA|nr:MAG: NAPDH-dependent diflavin reductase [Heterodermia speciosa]